MDSFCFFLFLGFIESFWRAGKIEHNGGGQENFVVEGYLEYRDSKNELENETAIEVDMRTAVGIGQGKFVAGRFFPVTKRKKCDGSMWKY